MKKSTILTFATAVAIVATSAGTFAAWDQLEDTSDVANLVVGTPVTVQAGTLTTFSDVIIFFLFCISCLFVVFAFFF